MPGHPPWSIVGGAAGPPGLRRIGPPRLRLQTQPLPRNDIQAAPTFASLGDAVTTLEIPFTRVLRIMVDGRDTAEGAAPLYSLRFVSSDESIFTVMDTDQENVKVLVPVILGSATLIVSGTPSPGLVPVAIVRTFEVTVVGVAASLVLTYTIDGGPKEQSEPAIEIPMNKQAVATVRAYDDQGRLVDITNVLFAEGSTKFNIITGADPATVTLDPDEIGGATLDVTCTADVAGLTVNLAASYTVSVVATIATHIAAAYDIELP